LPLVDIGANFPILPTPELINFFGSPLTNRRFGRYNLRKSIIIHHHPTSFPPNKHQGLKQYPIKTLLPGSFTFSTKQTTNSGENKGQRWDDGFFGGN